MEPKTRRLLHTTGLACLIVLSGCGGGGGGDGGNPAQPPVAEGSRGTELILPISGTVAQGGVPVAGARIELFDPSTSLTTTTTSGANGEFQIESSQVRFPAILRASGGNANNEVFHLVLFERPTTANLTPFSEAYSARLLRQLPAALFGNAAAANAALAGIDAADTAQAHEDLIALLGEEGIAVDTSRTPDLVTGTFRAAPGDPVNRLLEQYRTTGVDTAAIASELATTGDTIPAASAGIVAVNAQLPATPTYSAQVSFTLSVADRKGGTFSGLPAGNFTLPPFSLPCSGGRAGSLTGTFGQVAVVENAGAARQNYSTMVLLDQSGSVVGSDPNNARIDGARALFAAATGDDEIGLGYFPAGSSASQYSPFAPVFGQSASSLETHLNALADSESGGTPLYSAVVGATIDVAAGGTRPRKALVVFSDGDANAGRETAESAIANANARNVTLYSVVLNSGGTSITKLDEFVSLGVRTGGAVFVASDVRRTLGAYRTLSAFLDGTAATYTVTATLSGSNQCGAGQATLPEGVRVATKAGNLTVPVVLTYQ